LAQLALNIRGTAPPNPANPAQPFVLQYNDMSLPHGGMFDVSGQFHAHDPPGDPNGHWTHDRGVDIDVGWNYATSQGPPVHKNDAGATPVLLRDLQAAVRNIEPGATVLQEGDHYHIRWIPCP